MHTPFTTVTSSNGRTFAVRFLPAGAMTTRANDSKPVVEFYDTTYADDSAFGPLGQFVSSYFVDTLLGETPYSDGTGGLLLDGGNAAAWSVDAEAMTTVREWLRATRDAAVTA